MPACSLAVPKIFFSHSHSQKLPAGTPTAWEPGYQDTDFLEPGLQAQIAWLITGMTAG